MALGSLKRATCLPASSRSSSAAVTVCAVGHLDEGDDLLSPALAGPAGDHHVGHGGVGDDGLLHLLGEDLLAAGVDGDRVAAEQLDLAVGQVPGPVAGNRVARRRRSPGRCGRSSRRRPGSREAPNRAGPASRARRRRARAPGSGPRSPPPSPARGRSVPVDTEPEVEATPIWAPVSEAPATSVIMTLGSTARSALLDAHAQRGAAAAEGHERAEAS